MMPIILGSESPRRKEILSYFSLPFNAISPDFDEQSLSFKGNIEQFACEIADGKATSIYRLFPHSIIVTADTLVFQEGKIYGKPANSEQAYLFLKELSGKWHQVVTGMTVRRDHEIFHASEETRVLFNVLNEKEIHTYQSNLNLIDKAGGYAIQKAGGLIVKRIEGCYYNVMGLPINTLRTLLQKVGIELWDYLQDKCSLNQATLK